MKRAGNIDKNGARRVKFGVELDRKNITSGWGRYESLAKNV
jgi:hypothetical protein